MAKTMNAYEHTHKTTRVRSFLTLPVGIALLMMRFAAHQNSHTNRVMQDVHAVSPVVFTADKSATNVVTVTRLLSATDTQTLHTKR